MPSVATVKNQQRSIAVFVLAILHLVGGGLALFFSLCGCGGLVLS